jgi:hypothetical protein
MDRRGLEVDTGFLINGVRDSVAVVTGLPPDQEQTEIRVGPGHRCVHLMSPSGSNLATLVPHETKLIQTWHPTSTFFHTSYIIPFVIIQLEKENTALRRFTFCDFLACSYKSYPSIQADASSKVLS